MRVIRPLRALSIIPALREITNAIIAAVTDLRSTMVIYGFFLTVFGVFLSSLFSGLLRYRCYDPRTAVFYEAPGLVCGTSAYVGRQCPPPPDTILVQGTYYIASPPPPYYNPPSPPPPPKPPPPPSPPAPPPERPYPPAPPPLIAPYHPPTAPPPPAPPGGPPRLPPPATPPLPPLPPPLPPDTPPPSPPPVPPPVPPPAALTAIGRLRARRLSEVAPPSMPPPPATPPPTPPPPLTTPPGIALTAGAHILGGRTFHVRVPTTTPAPVLVVMHGVGGNGNEYVNQIANRIPELARGCASPPP